MIISTGNNFGSGPIKIKAYQAENYLVLNTKFTVEPSSTEYQAADVLEIYVPKLRIDRSCVTPVYVAFHDRRNFYGSSTRFDCCTIVKSWIKDYNTICVEKEPGFEQYGTLYFFIATLYPQLNQGGITPRSTKVIMKATEDAPYLTIDNDPFFVVTEHWVFLKGTFSCKEVLHVNGTWNFGLDGFPDDVNMQLPLYCDRSQYHQNKTGFSEMLVKNGRFVSVARMSQGREPRMFLFLVRGDNEGYSIDDYPMAQGSDHMMIVIDNTVPGTQEFYMRATLELGQSPQLMSVEGDGHGTGPELSTNYIITPNPKRLPQGETGFIARSAKKDSLAIYYTHIYQNAMYESININYACDAPQHEEVKLFDTGFMRNDV